MSAMFLYGRTRLTVTASLIHGLQQFALIERRFMVSPHDRPALILLGYDGGHPDTEHTHFSVCKLLDVPYIRHVKDL